MNRSQHLLSRLTYSWLALFMLCAGCAGLDRAQAPAAATVFELEELSITDLQAAMDSGRYTSRQLVALYLQRIEQIDRDAPALHAILETNPDALMIADALDAERRRSGPRGPLHGIPVVLKDNIDTGDRMMTTAGSLALDGWLAPQDAFIVTRLREAGAVILAKTNLSEWANFRSTRSSSGWSARGGQVKNPYALVGIKPTVGLLSRSGIIPISHTQDTAGPMARTVQDAALMLTAMAGRDPADPATDAAPVAVIDYAANLDANALVGARIGVSRARHFGYSPAADRAVEAAIETLRSRGAVIVDPVEIPTLQDISGCELEVLLYEFKAGLNAYLERLGDEFPARSLAELIDFNRQEAARSMPYFDQEIFELAEQRGDLGSEDYQQSLQTCTRLAGAEGIDAVMQAHRLDALVAPTVSPAWPIDLVNGDHYLGASSSAAAVAGYPNITVPAGEAFGLPVGLSFFGTAWSEVTLIQLAYAYEQATVHRRAPAFLPTIVLDDPAG